MMHSRISLRMGGILLDDFPSTLTRDCGDKKNRNPHVFPIFPVDYPYYRKGHSFIMDSYKQARSKPRAKLLTDLTGTWPAFLILVIVLLVSLGQPAMAQQPAKSASKTSGGWPSKFPSSKASTLPSNPS